MKVQFGNCVKDIPKEYYKGTWLITENHLEAHGKTRLTPWERFLFAEAAMRTKQKPITREYLSEYSPVGVVAQTNRSKETRYVVIYDDGLGFRATLICPKRLYHVCPKKFRTVELVNF